MFFSISFEDQLVSLATCCIALGLYRGFAEYCRDLLGFYSFNDFGNLLQVPSSAQALTAGVEFLHVGVARLGTGDHHRSSGARWLSGRVLSSSIR